MVLFRNAAAAGLLSVLTVCPLVGGTPGVALPQSRGITETVATIMQRDRFGSVSIEADQSAVNPQTVGVNFLAMTLSDSGFFPPDSMGAVSPTQILAIANGRIRVFDKNGILGSLNTTTNNFFVSVRGGFDTAHPHVRYDRLSGRWFVLMINTANPTEVLLAMSSGSTITDSSSFTFFHFTGSAAPAIYADEPSLGVDKFALYIGINEWTAGGPERASAFVVRKADLINNSILTVTVFRGVAVAGAGGPYAPQGGDNDDPSAAEGYFVGVDWDVFSRLVVLRVSDPGGTPTISSPLNISVPTTYVPINQVAQGSTTPLSALDDRLCGAQIQGYRGLGTKTLWTAHNIPVTSAGVGSNIGDRNATRWYEIGNLTTTPTVVQVGTLYDSAATNPIGYWIPSVAASRQGHMAVGTSRAGANSLAGIAVAGRLRGDALGLIQFPIVAQAGVGTYNSGAGTPQRWGGYSQTVVDPVDGQTMWTFQEYASSIDHWGVRVIQLKAPPPATPASASPSIVSPGQPSINVVITGTSSAGSEFFDPGPDAGGPGFQNHIGATISGGVTVNSVTFDSATQVSLNISTVGATPGAQVVTVINPDGQFTSSTSGILTVCSTPAPTITPGGPTTFCQGGSVTLTSSAATGNQWYLNGNAIPGAINQTYDATSGGSYTVTGTVAGCTSLQSSPVTVTVNPIPPAATITADGSTTICSGYQVTLTSSATEGNDWYLNGQPIPFAIGQTYSADLPGDYTVIYTDMNGCISPPSAPVTLIVNPTPDPFTINVSQSIPVGGGTASVDPHPGYSYTWTVDGGTITSGQGTEAIQFNGPPGTRLNLTVTETNSFNCSRIRLADVMVDFLDVPPSHLFHDFVIKLAINGITGGCGGGNYCVNDPVLRSQMAVFLLRGEHGDSYAPPAAVGVFADVPVPSFFADFIEQLYTEGITGGCALNPLRYCPNNSVLRSQMAIFLLRAEHGSAYVPPAAQGVFQDVPPGSFAADFVEQLAAEGITGGCSLNPPLYCPNAATTRGAMAVFLVRTFNLQ